MDPTTPSDDRVIDATYLFNGTALPEPLTRVDVNTNIYPELEGIIYADRAGNLFERTTRVDPQHLLTRNGSIYLDTLLHTEQGPTIARVPIWDADAMAATPYTRTDVFLWVQEALSPDDQEFLMRRPTFFDRTHAKQIADAVQLAKEACEVGYD